MITKKQLFDNDDEGQDAPALKHDTKLKTNEKFVQRFEKREKFKLMQKGKLMDQEMDEESSEYSSEDSDGILINDKVEQKFLETIARIRSNDPKLKENQDELFKDDDFELEKIAPSGTGSGPKGKPLTIKTMYVEKMKQRFGKHLDGERK